jgi:WD40 repeat protein
VTFSPDGKRLASSSDDKTTRIWDVATLSLQKTLAWLPERVPGVIFLPGGKLRTASLQGATVTLWDADSWTPISTLKGHTEGIQCLRSSADGKLLATGSGDRTVRLWDTATGEQLAVFKRHEGTVSDVTFSHDGRWLASAGADKTINLWDVAQRAPKASFPGQGDAVQGLAFSPNDTILASCADDGMVRLWDPTTKSHLAVAARHTQRVWGVAFSPDGSTLASASEDGTVKVSRFLHGLVRNIGVNGSRPYHLAFSPDGRGLAQVDVSDGGIGRLWDLASGKLRAVIPGEGTHQVVFTPDGRTAITRCSPTPPRSCFLQISDLGTGELQRRFDDMESSALSPQGERLAMSNRSARIWVRTLQGQLEQEIRLPRGRTLCLAYHPDGNLLGVGTDYGAIWLHDFATSTWGEVPLHFYGEYNQIAFSPDGTTIAGQIESRFLCLCDLSTRRLRIHQDLIDLSGFAFSPDGKTLATTGTTGRVILWNVATGLRLLEWDVPNRVSYAIAFSKDGQTLAASGVANIVGTAYLWSAPRNIEVPAREEP